MNRGKLITLEGAEGVGKSSNVVYIAEYLHARGKRITITREPGGTPLGERIRSILLDHKSLDPNAELLLLFAARAQHLQELVLPALAQGQWVICDRFTDASYAYQGGGRGIDERRIRFLADWIQQGLEPQLTLLFDAPVEVGLSRISARGELDRFESEQIDFFERVRRAYHGLAQRFPDRIKIVNAMKPLADVQLEIAQYLDALLAHDDAQKP
jgi:dTMP kinase